MSRRNREDFIIPADLASNRNHGHYATGDKVFIVGDHPHSGSIATLIAFEQYGLGWTAWRAGIDHVGECYVTAENLAGVPAGRGAKP